MRGHFRPATLDQYIEWLRGFLGQDGKPTHSYRYRFQTDARRFLYVPDGVFTLYHETGSAARVVIVADGAQKNPLGGLGQNVVMFMDGFWLLSNPPFVPVYSDPAFLELPGVRRFIQKD